MINKLVFCDRFAAIRIIKLPIWFIIIVCFEISNKLLKLIDKGNSKVEQQ